VAGSRKSGGQSLREDWRSASRGFDLGLRWNNRHSDSRHEKGHDAIVAEERGDIDRMARIEWKRGEIGVICPEHRNQIVVAHHDRGPEDLSPRGVRPERVFLIFKCTEKREAAGGSKNG
jgi:hypothetical protein